LLGEKKGRKACCCCCCAATAGVSARVAAHAAAAAVHATFGFVLCSNPNPDELPNFCNPPQETLAFASSLIDYF